MGGHGEGPNGAAEILATGKGEEGLGRLGRMGSLIDWHHALSLLGNTQTCYNIARACNAC